jgi:hypothetical protein
VCAGEWRRFADKRSINLPRRNPHLVPTHHISHHASPRAVHWPGASNRHDVHLTHADGLAMSAVSDDCHAIFRGLGALGESRVMRWRWCLAMVAASVCCDSICVLHTTTRVATPLILPSDTADSAPPHAQHMHAAKHKVITTHL